MSFCVVEMYENNIVDRCLVPQCDGITYKYISTKEDLWDRYYTTAPRRRTLSEQQYSEATVKRYHYGSHEQLKTHIYDFIMAYNFAKRLKTLKGLTPYEYICKIWTKEPK